MSAAGQSIRYKRSRFTTRLPADRLYTASHFWLAREDGDQWRIGFTKFAVRMLGEIVEFGFEVKPDEPVATGRIIGWLEGFKASSDLYCVVDGTFIGINPDLAAKADLVHADPYDRGWLYRAQGKPDVAALDVTGYTAVLDRAIDKIQGEDHHE